MNMMLLLLLYIFNVHGSGDWSYSGHDGPDHWPHVCTSGMKQSPVNLSPCSAEMQAPKAWQISNLDAQLVGELTNNGHTAKLSFQSRNVSVSGGDLLGHYNLVQAHFHWGSSSLVGSEHQLEGRQAPMEVHLVHFNNKYKDVGTALQYTDGLAVLGSMFHISEDDNPGLSPVLEALPSIKRSGATNRTSQPVSLSALVPSDISEYLRYSGSLTTPGCYEVVTWTIFKQSIPISETQLEVFRGLTDQHNHQLADNFRPIQPLNKRIVNFYSNQHDCNGTITDKETDKKTDSSNSNEENHRGSSNIPEARLAGSAGLSPVLAATIALFCLSGTGFIDAGFSRTPGDLVLIKYLSIIMTGSLVYWILGFGLSCGESFRGLIGTSSFLAIDVVGFGLSKLCVELCSPLLAALLVATILGTRIQSRMYYLTLTTTISGVIFPILSHWTSTEKGWLVASGYYDAAGCGSVHLLAATVATVVLRNTAGAQSKVANVAIDPDVPLVGVGSLLLILSLILQNIAKAQLAGGSTGQSLLTSMLAMSAVSLVLMVEEYFSKDQSRNYLRWMNAVMTAAVAVRSGSHIVPTWAAAIFGLAAAALYLTVNKHISRLGISDGTGLIAVNGVGGVLGLLLAPLLRQDGLLTTGKTTAAVELGMNIVGCVVVVVWAAATTFGLTTILNRNDKIKAALFKTVDAETSGETKPLN